MTWKKTILEKTLNKQKIKKNKNNKDNFGCKNQMK